MMRYSSLPWSLGILSVFVAFGVTSNNRASANPHGEHAELSGVRPLGPDNEPLNLDFEAGDLRDWTSSGSAFESQPIEGDTVRTRRADMTSAHQGAFWIGGYERQGDRPRGTLTSVPFKVTHPFGSFLIAGGPHRETRVEIINAATGSPLFIATGDESEELKRVVIDLRDEQGREIQVQIVDEHSGHWGHVNFDDFLFHVERPDVPDRAVPPPPDLIAHEGLEAEAAVAAMTLPEGFEVTLAAAEPDVIRPIAMSIDDRGRVWILENHTYPLKVAPEEAKDRILIFEDEDGDGRFDSRRVFFEGLSMATGLEVGFGGVWVGAAPELLFIPDRDGDDTPDGPPEVLLDGWGLQDTHETLNSFMWGPDGWLYGCHGVFTHSRVGKPGTPDEDRIPINAGVWRYHPQRHQFEVFAHGTSNPWGLDFDSKGELFIEACVIPHLYHLAQGGRYQRQAGQHFNPYTYDDIKTIADHVHYIGQTPHSGNGRSDAAGGGHAHSGLMIYQGGTWPEEYHGALFMNNIHGARINQELPEPDGSGYIGRHAPDFLLANDRASQILDFRYGPDGNVWVIDWYDLQQCHRREASAHDKSKGRIYKITFGESKDQTATARATLDPGNLISSVLQSQIMDDGSALDPDPWNEWNFRHARRLLQERGLSDQERESLIDITLRTDRLQPGLDEDRRLRILWALHATGGVPDEATLRYLDRSDDETAGKKSDEDYPHLRAWTIRLIMEERHASKAQLEKFIEIAETDPSPVVRLALASALQRMPVQSDARWAILTNLLMHGEDAEDQNLPLMLWYALEPMAAADPSRALSLAARSPLPRLLEFTTRRVGAIGTDEAIALLVDGLDAAESPETILTILKSINIALQGRRAVAMPARWPAIFTKLLEADQAEIRSQATGLALTFGDTSAREVLVKVLTDRSVATGRRRQALDALRKTRAASLPSRLRELLNDPAIRGDALQALGDFDDPLTTTAILKIYGGLPLRERRYALATLAARPGSAESLLEAIGQGRVNRSDLSADLVRQMRNLGNSAISEKIDAYWGTVAETSADKAALIARFKEMLSSSPAQESDLALGRSLFVKTCAQCHVLFGEGGNVGPELTGSNRADLDYLLSNVLHPSALIGKDYQANLLATSDGRVLTGIIRAEDANALTLVTADEIFIIPQDEIDARRMSDESMMPDNLWSNLSEHEIRSMVAYLASPVQTRLLATKDTAPRLFNGKDLSGWVGDRKLWSVENGEIVGKSDGLNHNEFLKSELEATNFRLTLEVKLTPNSENSGIQFRSTALPDGEVKGYQADIGEGWWGKLYEELGRGLLWEKSGEAFVEAGEWNSYEIIAEGSKIKTLINGNLCVDLDDSEGADRGIFAFQLHSGGPMEVRFRNLKLEVLETVERSSASTTVGEE